MHNSEDTTLPAQLRLVAPPEERPARTDKRSTSPTAILPGPGSEQPIGRNSSPVVSISQSPLDSPPRPLWSDSSRNGATGTAHDVENREFAIPGSGRH